MPAILKAAGAGIKNLCEHEGLESPVIAMAPHYNTDNLHIHMAVIEPTATREKEVNDIYRLPAEWVKEHNILEGRPGRFKPGTHEALFRTAKKAKGKQYYYALKAVKDTVKAETGRAFYPRSKIGVEPDGSILVYMSRHARNTSVLPDCAEHVGIERESYGTFKKENMKRAKSLMQSKWRSDDTRDNLISIT